MGVRCERKYGVSALITVFTFPNNCAHEPEMHVTPRNFAYFRWQVHLWNNLCALVMGRNRENSEW